MLEPHNLPFAVALALMVLLALVQGLGLADALSDADAGDGAADDATGVLAALLGLGRVPLMVWLAVFLLVFAALGVSIQQLATGLLGAPLDRWLAALGAGAAALPATGALVRPLANILPGDESTAVPRDALVGRRAVVQTGTARNGAAARAQVADRHGQLHHVMVEPHDAGGALMEGDTVLLLRREGEIFYATALEPAGLRPLP